MLLSNVNPVNYINDKISSYLLTAYNTAEKRNLIKKQSENLHKNGDFSFPTQTKIWLSFHSKSIQFQNDSIFYYEKFSDDKTETEIFNDLLEVSQSWIFPLYKLQIVQDRCIVFLKRANAINLLINESLQNQPFAKQMDSSSCKSLYFTSTDTETNLSLSNRRVKLVETVIRNLAKFNGWKIVDKFLNTDDSIITINVHSIAQKNKNTTHTSEGRSIFVSCGNVCDSQDNKIAKISYPDYLSMRSKDMQLMAMHKYGIRIRDDQRFKDILKILGEAAVTVDMLEVKHTSPLSIKRSGQGSSKGASFILYNCARAETILKKFNIKCDSGYYPMLPSLQDIDTSLLKEEEEWQLIFNYVLYFPELMRRSMDGIEQGMCSPHLICKFLSSLVSLFSVYYRRVRILTENRSQLLPVLFARIYLIKSIQFILRTCLGFLNIEPVYEM